MIFSYLFGLFFLIVSVQKPLFKLCKTDFDMEEIHKEESEYRDLPKFYNFKSRDERERILYANFNQVTQDVNKMVKDLQQFFKQ